MYALQVILKNVLIETEVNERIAHVDFRLDKGFRVRILVLVDNTFFQLSKCYLRANSFEVVNFAAMLLHNKDIKIVENCLPLRAGHG